MSAASLWVDPLHVSSPDDCYFQYTRELPTVGLVHGAWDIRTNISTFLGDLDFRNRRCLDLGSEDGYLTFEMERRGASEVVSVDFDASRSRELAQFARDDAAMVGRQASLRDRRLREQRAYWFAHRLLGSRARAHYGNFYDLPSALGEFDIVLLGMTLPHARDPFHVLEQAVLRCPGGAIVVTQQAPGIDGAWAYFMPDPATQVPDGAWWSMSEDCLCRMLECLGCSIERTARAQYRCPARTDQYAEDTEECLTVVARR